MPNCHNTEVVQCTVNLVMGIDSVIVTIIKMEGKCRLYPCNY